MSEDMFLLLKKSLSCKVNSKKSMQITNVFQNKNDEFYKEVYIVAYIFVFYQRKVSRHSRK